MILDPKATSATEIPWYEVLHQPRRTALLTGGSGGIGSATKRLLESHGWNVIAPTRAELDLDNVQSIAEYLLRDVNLYDALIFCHGEWYSSSRSIITDFEKQYNSRVSVPYWLMATLLIRNRVKHVVMVASTRGLIGGVNTAPYAASCAAQIALMVGYSREYKGDCRFNCVCPGLTASRMAEQVRATGGCKSDAIAQPPEAVAGVIVGLCEDGVSNGKIVKVVDGKATLMQWEQMSNSVNESL